MLQAPWELRPVGMVLGRRKCEAVHSSATSAMHRAAPQGQRSHVPHPSRHQSLLSGSSSPVLPIGNVTPVPTVWELPGAGTMVGSRQKQQRVLSPRERC